jgi:hypothetical protein
LGAAAPWLCGGGGSWTTGARLLVRAKEKVNMAQKKKILGQSIDFRWSCETQASFSQSINLKPTGLGHNRSRTNG